MILAQFSAAPRRDELFPFWYSPRDFLMAELAVEVQFQFLTLKLNNQHNLKGW